MTIWSQKNPCQLQQCSNFWKQTTKVRLVQEDEIPFNEQSDEDHAVVEEQEEDLEIFESAAEILSENSDNNRTRQPNQSALNLLPNNDILNQIANQTGSWY